MSGNQTHLDSEFNNAGMKAAAAGKAGFPSVHVAAGALDLSTKNNAIEITQGGDQAFTLAAGDEFQEKTIGMRVKSGAGNAVVTPAGGLDNAGAAVTTITLNSVGDFVRLIYLGAKWRVEQNSGCVLA
jgi:hypothetical protein